MPTEWNPELFRSGLTNALKAKPEANCVFAASDFAYTAIQAALEGAGVTRRPATQNTFGLL